MRVGASWLNCTLATACTLFGSGCLSLLPNRMEEIPTTYAATANSLILDNRVSIRERSTREVDRRLEARVWVQNVSRKGIQFEYRFAWLCKDGARIAADGVAWTPLLLHANQSALLRGVASSPSAADFLIVIRQVRRPTM